MGAFFCYVFGWYCRVFSWVLCILNWLCILRWLPTGLYAYSFKVDRALFSGSVLDILMNFAWVKNVQMDFGYNLQPFYQMPIQGCVLPLNVYQLYRVCITYNFLFFMVYTEMCSMASSVVSFGHVWHQIYTMASMQLYLYAIYDEIFKYLVSHFVSTIQYLM